ncbi:hypothetical protein ACLKA6_015114 [Drosophila palustris]
MCLWRNLLASCNKRLHMRRLATQHNNATFALFATGGVVAPVGYSFGFNAPNKNILRKDRVVDESEQTINQEASTTPGGSRGQNVRKVQVRHVHCHRLTLCFNFNFVN